MNPFGISLKENSEKEIYSIHRFKVYDAVRHPLLYPDEQTKNRNYQVCGNENEKLVVRIFFNDKKQLHKARYYYAQEMDKELAKYLVLELIERLKLRFKFSKQFELKEIEHW